MRGPVCLKGRRSPTCNHPRLLHCAGKWQQAQPRSQTQVQVPKDPTAIASAQGANHSCEKGEERFHSYRVVLIATHSVQAYRQEARVGEKGSSERRTGSTAQREGSRQQSTERREQSTERRDQITERRADNTAQRRQQAARTEERAGTAAQRGGSQSVQVLSLYGGPASAHRNEPSPQGGAPGPAGAGPREPGTCR